MVKYTIHHKFDRPFSEHYLVCTNCCNTVVIGERESGARWKVLRETLSDKCYRCGELFCGPEQDIDIVLSDDLYVYADEIWEPKYVD